MRPSQFFTKVLDEFDAAISSGKYVCDMGWWIMPSREKCYVCLGGSYLASSIPNLNSIPKSEYGELTPGYLLEQGIITPTQCNAAEACNAFRQGDLKQAAQLIGYEYEGEDVDTLHYAARSHDSWMAWARRLVLRYVREGL